MRNEVDTAAQIRFEVTAFDADADPNVPNVPRLQILSEDCLDWALQQ